MSITTDPTSVVPVSPTKAAPTNTTSPVNTPPAMTDIKDESEEALPNDRGDGYQLPSKMVEPEMLTALHQNGVWFPEEVNTTKFKFADKTASFGPHKLVNINHEELPWRNKEGKRIDVNIKFPKMWVLSLKWRLSEKTGLPGSTKLILSFDNRDEAFKKPGSDENNFYQYLSKMDDALRNSLFEKRKAWGLSYSNVNKAKDAYNDGQPLVSYGKAIGDTPENSNPWLDENGNIVEDYENYQGKMSRKYGPKFYGIVAVPYKMKDVLQSDGSYKKVKEDEDRYICEFINGYTGESIDLKPSNIQAWFEQEKKGLQAEGYYWQRFVQLVTNKAPFIRNEVRQICLYPTSSRPTTESAPLPRGLGISQAKVAVDIAPEAEPAQSTAQIQEVPDEESMPVATQQTTPIIVSSHDKYLESMKQEAAAKETGTANQEKKKADGGEEVETTETTPIKKKKQRTH